MSFLLGLAALAAGAAPTIDRANACGAFLIGGWAGKSLVKGFGTPIQVDNSATYRRDGSFLTRNRYLDSEGKWVEQKLAGTWKAEPSRKRNECKLTMRMQGQGFESGSSSDISMVGKHVFRSLGFDMHGSLSGRKQRR